MEVIIYLAVVVAIVFVPYFIGHLCLKDDFGFGNPCTDWLFGIIWLYLISMVILGVIAISNVIINAI